MISLQRDRRDKSSLNQQQQEEEQEHPEEWETSHTSGSKKYGRNNKGSNNDNSNPEQEQQQQRHQNLQPSPVKKHQQSQSQSKQRTNNNRSRPRDEIGGSSSRHYSSSNTATTVNSKNASSSSRTSNSSRHGRGGGNNSSYQIHQHIDADPLPLGPQLVGEKILVGNGSSNNTPKSPTTPQQQTTRMVSVQKLLGEGGFSYVYLVQNCAADGGISPTVASSAASSENKECGGAAADALVLKVTSIHSRAQREIAEREAALLRKLSHPSIVKLYDVCYRYRKPPSNNITSSSNSGSNSNTYPHNSGDNDNNNDTNSKQSNSRDRKQRNKSRSPSRRGRNKDDNSGQSSSISHTPTSRPQHMILMEYCENGHALEHIASLRNLDFSSNLSANSAHNYMPLNTLIVSFGQICNAVSYLHAQKPPIVHRDLKLENFLLTQSGSIYKLCDFGSAVFGHVPLETSAQRNAAEEVIQRTTTQMYRAPEMVDLYMKNKLTPKTDVWALGCCLYMMAFQQNCFEEGSNLAILSNNYKVPQSPEVAARLVAESVASNGGIHAVGSTGSAGLGGMNNAGGNVNHHTGAMGAVNIYGDGLVELIERMLTSDADYRADMAEVILCLSALYTDRPLPERKKKPPTPQPNSSSFNNGRSSNNSAGVTRGAYRTDGQGIVARNDDAHFNLSKNTNRKAEGKKLKPNSAAARRRAAALAAAGATHNNGETTTGSTSKSKSTKPSNTAAALTTAPPPPLNTVLSSESNHQQQKQQPPSLRTSILTHTAATASYSHSPSIMTRKTQNDIVSAAKKALTCTTSLYDPLPCTTTTDQKPTTKISSRNHNNNSHTQSDTTPLEFDAFPLDSSSFHMASFDAFSPSNQTAAEEMENNDGSDIFSQMQNPFHSSVNIETSDSIDPFNFDSIHQATPSRNQQQLHQEGDEQKQQNSPKEKKLIGNTNAIIPKAVKKKRMFFSNSRV
mmetsp:Transcript_61677/g.72072  ORF Transcript_61677/g.72072 Transcript_61677/m.72072 type:complete len:961 (+) Transcript_61677:710-3592(+)